MCSSASSTRSVLPAVHYGCRTSPGPLGGIFPGATSLRGSTLAAVVGDVLRASYRNGARRFVITQAHIANIPVVFEALELFLSDCPDATVMSVAWWEVFGTEDTRDAFAEETGTDRSQDHHAAMTETSLMLHLAPEAVRLDRIGDDRSARRVQYIVLPLPADLRTEKGIVYDATKATAEVGGRLMKIIEDNLVEAVRLELGGPGRGA